MVTGGPLIAISQSAAKALQVGFVQALVDIWETAGGAGRSPPDVHDHGSAREESVKMGSDVGCVAFDS